jgi:hypothetical protein
MIQFKISPSDYTWLGHSVSSAIDFDCSPTSEGSPEPNLSRSDERDCDYMRFESSAKNFPSRITGHDPNDGQTWRSPTTGYDFVV